MYYTKTVAFIDLLYHTTGQASCLQETTTVVQVEAPTDIVDKDEAHREDIERWQVRGGLRAIQHSPRSEGHRCKYETCCHKEAVFYC